jgi:hypothetical protein
MLQSSASQGCGVPRDFLDGVALVLPMETRPCYARCIGSWLMRGVADGMADGRTPVVWMRPSFLWQ